MFPLSAVPAILSSLHLAVFAMTVTVLLADSHPIIRTGLQSLLTDDLISVVGEANDGKDAFELTERLRPRLLISEVTMPRMDGLTCLTKINELELPTKVLFYTGQINPTYAARAMALGAVGLINKSTPIEPLVGAIKQAARGKSVWSEQAVRRHTGGVLVPPQDGAAVMPSLTTRESEVLKQLAFGLSNKEIAQALGISYETVKEHVQHVLRKLGVADRTQAAVWAVRNRLA